MSELEDAVEVDDRPRVETSKRIDLALLTEELGGVGLAAGDGVVVVAEVDSGVTQKQLADAIDAHQAPTVPEPVQPLTDAEVTALRALLGSV